MILSECDLLIRWCRPIKAPPRLRPRSDVVERVKPLELESARISAMKYSLRELEPSGGDKIMDTSDAKLPRVGDGSGGR